MAPIARSSLSASPRLLAVRRLTTRGPRSARKKPAKTGHQSSAAQRTLTPPQSPRGPRRCGLPHPSGSVVVITGQTDTMTARPDRSFAPPRPAHFLATSHTSRPWSLGLVRRPLLLLLLLGAPPASLPPRRGRCLHNRHPRGGVYQQRLEKASSFKDIRFVRRTVQCVKNLFYCASRPSWGLKGLHREGCKP